MLGWKCLAAQHDKMWDLGFRKWGLESRVLKSTERRWCVPPSTWLPLVSNQHLAPLCLEGLDDEDFVDQVVATCDANERERECVPVLRVAILF